MSSHRSRKHGGARVDQTVVVISLILLALQSCANPVTVPVGEEFKIRYGQVTVEDGGFTIRFREVEEDYRCPQDVICIWPGNARIILRVVQTTMALNTYVDPREVSYSSYTVRLTLLNPPRWSDRDISPEDYVASLIVTKN